MTKKVCVISCKDDPKYIRSRTLWAAVEQMPGTELIVVRNTSKGIMRYPQVMWGVVKARFQQKPDVYIQTFRAYELLAWVRLVTLGKPLIVDEFINPLEWAAFERSVIKRDGIIYKAVWQFWRWLLNSAQHVTTDTDAHADFSSELMKMPREKFTSLPVATDEAVFQYLPYEPKADAPLEVFFYGHILPLQGFDYMLAAAEKMKDSPIRFTFIGGKGSVAERIEGSVRSGANITYKPWIEFDKIPEYIGRSDVCLAGPFGGTFQGQMVITTKTFQFMACGRTTIVGRVKAWTPFVDMKNSLVVPQADTNAIVKALEWALDNREKLGEIGKNAAETYRNELSVDVVSSRLQKLL